MMKTKIKPFLMYLSITISNSKLRIQFNQITRPLLKISSMQLQIWFVFKIALLKINIFDAILYAWLLRWKNSIVVKEIHLNMDPHHT